MPCPSRLTCAWALVAAAITAGCGGDAPRQQGNNLIGGHDAEAGQFPATMKFGRECTAAKVGPRHVLLAAHCIHDDYDNDVRSVYAPGRQVNLYPPST